LRYSEIVIKKIRPKTILAITLLIIILALFSYYIIHHPQIITSLKHTSIWLILAILSCYFILLGWWMGVYNQTLNLCAQPLKTKQNMLLTIYSTLANFFLPLQSGPAIRAGYLKKRHKVPISNYLLATVFYFAIYAVISAAFLFVASSYWWIVLPATIAAGVISYGVFTFVKNKLEKRSGKISLDLSPKKVIKLVLLTLGQLLTQVLIYGIELNSLNLPQFTIRRVFSYAGAANFSLFVSLTPGGIGFREAFLEFSRSLHHFTTNAILAANIIDRGVFLIFLGLLLIIMLATHAKDKLKI